jgi:hypothetical protein
MDFPCFGFGTVHLNIKGFQHQYRAYSYYTDTDMQAALALYWWQRLEMFGSSLLNFNLHIYCFKSEAIPLINSAKKKLNLKKNLFRFIYIMTKSLDKKKINLYIYIL